MPVHVIFTSYPQPNGPAFYTGAGFLTREILINVLSAEFEKTELPNFRCFLAREFELPEEREKFS